jgi:hypothetical protein
MDINDIFVAGFITAFLLWGYKMIAALLPRGVEIRDPNDAVIYVLSILGSWFTLATIVKYDDINVAAVLLTAAIAEVSVFLREFLVVAADACKVVALRRQRRS